MKTRLINALACAPTQSLHYLSLKCCGISHEHLSNVVSPLQDNKTLVTLDLSCNHVGDEGARHLARALRLNRSLLSLILVGNRIGDRGARALAAILVQFPLTHEEIVARRWLLSQRRTEDELVRLASVHVDPSLSLPHPSLSHPTPHSHYPTPHSHYPTPHSCHTPHLYVVYA